MRSLPFEMALVTDCLSAAGGSITFGLEGTSSVNVGW